MNWVGPRAGAAREGDGAGRHVPDLHVAGALIDLVLPGDSCRGDPAAVTAPGERGGGCLEAPGRHQLLARVRIRVFDQRWFRADGRQPVRVGRERGEGRRGQVLPRKVNATPHLGLPALDLAPLNPASLRHEADLTTLLVEVVQHHGIRPADGEDLTVGPIGHPAQVGRELAELRPGRDIPEPHRLPRTTGEDRAVRAEGHRASRVPGPQHLT